MRRVFIYFLVHNSIVIAVGTVYSVGAWHASIQLPKHVAGPTPSCETYFVTQDSAESDQNF